MRAKTLHLILDLCLILGSARASADDTPTLRREASRLECHLALASEPKVYLEVTRSAIMIYARGVELGRLPVLQSDLPVPSRFRFSNVSRREGAVQTREVVVRVEHVSANPSDTVSSPEEIVSVDDMPETFAVRLADGSTFLVTGQASDGFLNAKRKEWLRFRVACSFLVDRLLGRPVKLAFIEMSPASARHFYWLLQDGMGVIY